MSSCCSFASSLPSTTLSLSKSDCSVPNSGLGLSGSRAVNLNRFSEHTTPVVPAQYLFKIYSFYYLYKSMPKQDSLFSFWISMIKQGSKLKPLYIFPPHFLLLGEKGFQEISFTKKKISKSLLLSSLTSATTLPQTQSETMFLSHGCSFNRLPQEIKRGKDL